MVIGIDVFKKHFADYSDRYVLIGGTACSVAMEDAGLEFRATKDLDIVLCVEALDAEFVGVFWKFIKNGRYDNVQKSTGKRLFYRFSAPTTVAYPAMIELFSRKPDMLDLTGDPKVIPMPIDEEVSSLSAILIDDDYYRLVRSGITMVSGLPIVMPLCLIPLKIRAWMDLSDRKLRGDDIDSKVICKHRDDVLRLFQIISGTATVDITGQVRNDMTIGVQRLKIEESIDERCRELSRRGILEVTGVLKEIYGLTQ